MKKRSIRGGIIWQFAIAVVSATLAMGQGTGAARPTPPPEPTIKPIVTAPAEVDKDGSKIDDRLEERAKSAQATFAKSTASAADKAAARKTLESTVTVELIFNKQITQAQIDAFLKAGGQITHVYESLSYGWTGSISLGQVQGLPQALGASLLGVVEPVEMKLHNMEVATQNGRVRPALWNDGYDGDSSVGNGITIAILDSGVDVSHTDLSGRQQLWQDMTGEGDLTAVDHNGHGTHVAGIATGTGAASGVNPTTLAFTVNGAFPNTPGFFSPAPMTVPASVSPINTRSSTMRWDTGGGGTAELGQLVKTTGHLWAGFPNDITGSASPLGPLTNNGYSNPPAAGYTNVYSPFASWSVAGTGTREYSVQNTISYAGAGDSYNVMRGVAPGSKWAGYKVFTNAGGGISSYTDAALDHLVANRQANNIKVANLSLGVIGNPGIYVTQRNKVNTAAANGVVVVISAGNDGNGGSAGAREVDDPGRAHHAITVAAASQINQVTNYSSTGFNAPGDGSAGDDDRKPDLAAPGGSPQEGYLLAPDSNTNDGGLSDGTANDYTPFQGTSMASPFVAGCAALVIDAIQQAGATWHFTGGSGEPLADVLKVKQLLLMTASETNTTREPTSASGNPTLNRGVKDIHEGYGFVNTDAAVDAVRLSPLGDLNGAVTVAPGAATTLGSGTANKRVWAQRINLAAGKSVNLGITVPVGADYDAYVYAEDPDTYGNPVILASSTVAATGGTEAILFNPPTTQIGYLVVKRVSGAGAFSVSGFAPVSISHFAIH